MADHLTAPKNWIKTVIARAKLFGLWLVGRLIAFKAWIEAGDIPHAPMMPHMPGAVRKPWLSKAHWDEIRDVAQSLPLVILKLCICAGLVLNLCRSQIESTPTANPLDGAALVSSELPQIDGWYWLAALWLILSVIEKVVKSITINIVSKA